MALAGFTFRQKITINSDDFISGDLSNQSVRVNIFDGNTDFWANEDGDGRYVRFTASDETTLLDFEVESYDDTGEDAWWHVEVGTLLNGSDTEIYIYYKADSPSSGDNKEGTWDANYKGVYHLNQDKTEGAFDDSTSTNNDLTNVGTTDGVGAIDRGRTLDGLDDYLNTDVLVADLASDTTGTWELTFEPTDSTPPTAERLICFGDTDALETIALTMDSDGKARTSLFNAGTVQWQLITEQGVFFNTTKAHVVLRHDGTEPEIFIDGVKVVQIFLVSTDKTQWFNDLSGIDNGRIGTLNFNSGGDIQFLDAIVDEVSFSNTDRSDDWIKARNQSRLGTWMSFGAQESVISAGIVPFRRRIEAYH